MILMIHKKLFTSAQDKLKPQTVFVAEAYNAAVIDTACSKTVCESKWLNKFIDFGCNQITALENFLPK